MKTPVLQNRISIPAHVELAIHAQDTAARDAENAEQAAKDTQLRSFLIDALEQKDAWAETLQDASEGDKIRKGLRRPGVNGSEVIGVRDLEDVKSLFSKLTNVTEVLTSKDNGIVVYQGTVPKNVKAFAAYASLNEIAEVYGEPALSTVQPKIGRFDGKVYLCTVQEIRTNTISIQVKEDTDGVVRLVQWFAGIDKDARIFAETGDAVVRCGVDIKPLEEQRAIADAKRAQQAARLGSHRTNVQPRSGTSR